MKLTKRKGFNFFRSYYDVYNELSNKDKIAFMDALLDRQFLGDKPENLQGMAKFAYISQTNSIDSQVKGYEDKTETRLDGRPYMKNESHPTDGGGYTPTDGGSHGGGYTPTEQEEEKEEEKEEEEVKRFNFKNSLLELIDNKQLVEDWMLVRRNKKASNTETAFFGFINEAKKSGLSLNEILTECVTNSWAGFKSEWIKKNNYGSRNSKGNEGYDEALANW